LTVDLDHTGIAGLDWAKLRVITDLRKFGAAAVDDIYQPLARTRFLYHTVNRDTDHESRPFNRFSLIVIRCREFNIACSNDDNDDYGCSDVAESSSQFQRQRQRQSMRLVSRLSARRQSSLPNLR
jgi:hypothetical protein